VTTFSPSTRRMVVKGAVADVIAEHRDAPDLATRITYAVMATLAELDAADACPVHFPTGTPCACGHDGGADCHPRTAR
jgi:hypothetical protein